MSPSFAAIVSALLPLISMVSGHMIMSNPPPIRFKDNPNSLPANIDYSYTSPLDSSGSDFPCKGYNKFFDTSEGASVATWAAGSTQTISIAGAAPHGGGSCQVSFSEDAGATFKVAKSYIGNCPLSTGTTTLSFTVPSSASSKKLLFAWTWFNKLGNREMYMNCAAVTVTGGGSGLSSSLPAMFVANIGNGCSTIDSKDVLFPDPGTDVVKDPGSTPVAPSGTCGTASSGTGTSPVVSSAPSPVSSAPENVPTPSASMPVPSPSPVASTSSVPEGIPSEYPCKRSVRYSVRNVPADPIPVQSGCQCTCTNNVPQMVRCGSSS